MGQARGDGRILDDRLVGVMATFARTSLTDAVLQAMGTVASVIARDIENASTPKMSCVESDWRLLLESTSEGIFGMDEGALQLLQSRVPSDSGLRRFQRPAWPGHASC